MVWFHGGAHTGGYAHVPLFDGKEFARKGVVLVTVNYRLGVWGFLAHPALSDESENDSSGNYGLLDKILSDRNLSWHRAPINLLRFVDVSHDIQTYEYLNSCLCTMHDWRNLFMEC